MVTNIERYVFYYKDVRIKRSNYQCLIDIPDVLVYTKVCYNYQTERLTYGNKKIALTYEKYFYFTYVFKFRIDAMIVLKPTTS